MFDVHNIYLELGEHSDITLLKKLYNHPEHEFQLIIMFKLS